MAVTVNADIEARVRDLVAQHRPQLERLVDQALDHALAELVAERLHAHNGNGRSQYTDSEASKSFPLVSL